MDIKTSGDLKWILELLTAMAETELIIGKFYEACSGLSQETLAFWDGISKAEIKHSENIKKMIHVISTKPERFEKGRQFNVFAIKTFNDGIRNYINRLKDGEIDSNRAFFIARDIEHSLLENRYGEIVKTDDIEFKGLLADIISETEEHKTTLERKCNERQCQKG
jgi:rubrerythrin